MNTKKNFSRNWGGGEECGGTEREMRGKWNECQRGIEFDVSDSKCQNMFYDQSQTIYHTFHDTLPPIFLSIYYIFFYIVFLSTFKSQKLIPFSSF